MKKPGIAQLALLLAACGTTDATRGNDANVVAEAQALAIPAPYSDPNAKKSAWGGSYVDLMVADTWSTCAFLAGRDQPINHKLVAPGDEYLDRLLTQMTAVDATWVKSKTNESPYPQQQWIDYRNDPTYNRNRASGDGESAGLKRRDLTRYTLSLADARFSAAQGQASEAVALAAMNTCIAQGVRSLALGGDTMLLSEAEQIQALEVVRERAQIAMLQYAALFNVIASPSGAAFSGTATTYQQIAFLQQWAATAPDKGGDFKAWVGDFAAAVQLHLTATSELAQLFGRSAAARSPRGGGVTTTADTEWGPGSWRQRVLALLYGGDPLAVEADGSTPWTNMVGRTAPGVALDTSIRSADPWPTAAELPYFQIDARDPHVIELVALARRADAVRLLQSADGSVDVETSAEQLFRAVEASVRTQQCASVVNGACATVAVADVPPWTSGGATTPIDAYLLFGSFGITRDHARAAVALLDQYAPQSGVSPIHPVGVLALQTDAKGTWRYVPRSTVDVPRTLDEISPLFERYSPYRIPASVDPNVERSHFETTSANVTYRIGDDQGLAAGGLYAASMRVLGAVVALSHVRDALGRALSSTAAPPELQQALGSVGPALASTIDAAIGARVTRIAPLETVKSYDWANSGIQNGRVATERLQTVTVQRSPKVAVLGGWAIDSDVVAGDGFFGDASASYDLVAVRNDPTAYWLALSPAARRFDGKGFADLAADKTGNAATAAVTLQANHLHSEIYLTAELLASTPPPTWTFVVRKTSGAAVAYRPLTGAVPLYAWQFNRAATGKTGELAPIFSYRVVTGGWLGRTAARAWAVQKSNPSRPAYDGFGLPTTWFPSADASAFGSQPGDSVMSYFLRNAKQASADATDAVRTAINSTLAQAQATLDEQAAQARSQLVVQQEAQGVCGAAAQTMGAHCAPPIAAVDLPVTWTPIAAAWVGVADPGSYCDAHAVTETDPVRKLDCMARRRVLGATRAVPLAQPVAVELADSSAPTFATYAGGSIQAVLVDEWSAVKRVANAASILENSKQATAQRIVAGQSTLKQLQATLDAATAQLTGLSTEQALVAQKFEDAAKAEVAQCGAAIAAIDDASGDSVQCESQIDQVQRELGNGQGLPHSAYACGGNSLITNPGKLAQVGNMVAACQSARAGFDDARLQLTQLGLMTLVTQKQADADKWALEAARGMTLAETLDSTSNVLRAAADLDTAVADAAKTIATIAELQEQAQLATARQQLESALSVQGAQLSLGLYRQYNQYDWWRARALLDGARRYATAARRAIETTYVVDMSTLTSPEPFVAAPASWVADAYRYDLSLPSAVGLASGGATPGASYPNQVLDYVGNLEQFVQGFAVQRPLTAAVDDEVIAVPGPGALLVKDGVTVADPARSDWSVLCPAASGCASATGAAWCPVTSSVPVASTCTVGGGGAPKAPLKARVTFYLDAWGRLVARAALTPLDKARQRALGAVGGEPRRHADLRLHERRQPVGVPGQPVPRV